MSYRTYSKQVKNSAAVLLIFGLCACASSSTKQDGQDTTATASAGNTTNNSSDYDGREPSSMKGDVGWLNDVENDFGRIAAETSTRAVASENQHEVLLKYKEWSFSYLPKTNHFYVDIQGAEYQMVQTKIDEGERFAFAAEGQSENPLTFAVTKGEGRAVASGDSCSVEISYWSKKSKSYVTENKELEGKNCEHLMGRLKDYVP